MPDIRRPGESSPPPSAPRIWLLRERNLVGRIVLDDAGFRREWDKDPPEELTLDEIEEVVFEPHEAHVRFQTHRGCEFQ